MSTLFTSRFWEHVQSNIITLALIFVGNFTERDIKPTQIQSFLRVFPMVVARHQSAFSTVFCVPGRN